MKVKIFVCMALLLIGIGMGWFLNARLAPPAVHHTGRSTPEEFPTSRLWLHNDPVGPFKPREYVRIIRMEPEGVQVP